ncbi:MAG: preprotein translocase subunit SecY [Pseudomonadota bacterium]
MASAAEQLAANMSWSTFGKAKELQQRILFTIAILIVYRIGTHIPMPGINPIELARFIEQTQQGILGVVNMFAGGAIERMAIFALGIMPYISASIIMQLMTTMVPKLEQLKKEGEQGRKKINQYTRYGTVFLATIQAYGIAIGLEGQGVVIEPGLFFRASAVITLVGGTVLLMWLGEQVTARGVGNGISLIIFVGIVATLPQAFGQFFAGQRASGGSALVIIFILAMIIAVMAFVVFVERAQRRIVIQYPQRQVGMRVYQGDRSHLPIKVNAAGVIPAIFASSLLLLPATVAGFSAQGGEGGGVLDFIAANLGRGSPMFIALFAGLIIFFCFFYTAIVFNPQEVAENLKKHGGFIPGVRPGQRTAEYLDYVLTRLTVVGAAYMAFVCVLPELVTSSIGAELAFALGGTSMLIVVSVTMDTISQVQSHLLAHQYEGLIKKSKLRGRKK